MTLAPTSRSSTSSSSSVLERKRPYVAETPRAAEPGTEAVGVNRTPRLALLSARLPWGAMLAIGLIAVLHGIAAYWLVPNPVAPRELRDRVVALTRNTRPSVIIAGDSRALRHIDPAVLEVHAGLKPTTAVNVGARGCETTTVMAVYREFHHRFAQRPIMLLSASTWLFNDRASGRAFFPSDATLWNMSFPDRLRVTTPGCAVRATFLPEITLWRRITEQPESPKDPPRHRGFLSVNRCYRLLPAQRAEEIAKNRAVLFTDARTNGALWRQFRRSVRELRAMGVQVVIFESPIHPDLLAALQGAGEAETARELRGRLAEFAASLAIPILRYDAGRLAGDDADELFTDLAHLNRTGAAQLSAWVGRDLRRLIDEGVLTLDTGSRLARVADPASP